MHTVLLSCQGTHTFLCCRDKDDSFQITADDSGENISPLSLLQCSNAGQSSLPSVFSTSLSALCTVSFASAACDRFEPAAWKSARTERKQDSFFCSSLSNTEDYLHSSECWFRIAKAEKRSHDQDQGVLVMMQWLSPHCKKLPVSNPPPLAQYQPGCMACSHKVK